jgi:taurine dioxygenase
MTTQLRVRPIAGSLGAEVEGVDLSALRDDDWRAVRSLWLEYLVLFFPMQNLSAAAHIQLARRLGTLEIHPFLDKLNDDQTEIVVLDSDRGEKADTWHTDVTFTATPPMASVLQMIVLPAFGGDTIWTNQYLVYEDLSPAMRDFLEGLTALHTGERFGHPEVAATHPVVVSHPETGRCSLFVNRSFTSHINELSRGESDQLLQYLYTFSEQPQFQCRYQWTEGTVAIWDNRCTQHYAVNDYLSRRVIHRVTVLGERPKGTGPRWDAFIGDDKRNLNRRNPRPLDPRSNSVAMTSSNSMTSSS